MDKSPIRIVQISDIHLFADNERDLLGVKTFESFQAVLDLVKREKDIIDLILLTGDLSQDGSEVAYQRVADLLKPFQVPVYFCPGNHDYPNVLAKVFPRPPISNHKHIVLKNWHIILLSSQKPGAVEGYLDAGQLDYMQHCLQTYPEHHAIVVFHHQPVPVGVAWLDNLGVKNADDFWKIIVNYPKAKTVLFGHVHQEHEQVKHGITCYSPPSTCIQFMRNQAHFGLENIPPGFRWVDLYEDGHLETGVLRVPHYVGHFDPDAKGY